MSHTSAGRMTKIRGRDIKPELRERGCTFLRAAGSDEIWTMPGNGQRITIRPNGGMVPEAVLMRVNQALRAAGAEEIHNHGRTPPKAKRRGQSVAGEQVSVADPSEKSVRGAGEWDARGCAPGTPGDPEDVLAPSDFVPAPVPEAPPRRRPVPLLLVLAARLRSARRRACALDLRALPGAGEALGERRDPEVPSASAPASGGESGRGSGGPLPPGPVAPDADLVPDGRLDSGGEPRDPEVHRGGDEAALPVVPPRVPKSEPTLIDRLRFWGEWVQKFGDARTPRALTRLAIGTRQDRRELRRFCQRVGMPAPPILGPNFEVMTRAQLAEQLRPSGILVPDGAGDFELVTQYGDVVFRLGEDGEPEGCGLWQLRKEAAP